jgi:hypothetical protein
MRLVVANEQHQGRSPLFPFVSVLPLVSVLESLQPIWWIDHWRAPHEVKAKP